jgi:hypothetical protein
MNKNEIKYSSKLIFYFAIGFVFTISLGLSNSTFAQTIYFDDSDPDFLKLGNTSFYEVGFRKTNGSIAYIIDKSTGANLTQGNRHEHLWGAMFPDAGWAFQGGGHFSATWNDRCVYTWNSSEQKLTFQYTPGPASSIKVTAMVEITPFDNSYFDLMIHLEHQFGMPMEHVSLPTALVFLEDDMEEALLPIIPGVILERSFFLESRTYQTSYPGWPGVFSDLISYKLRNGHLGIYTLFRDIHFEKIITIVIGCVDDDEYIPGTTFLRHNFQTYITDGQEFISPVVRIHVGQTHNALIEHFRSDNKIDQYPSVVEKLGDDFNRVAKSPFLKVNFETRFPEYDSILERIPSPAILHPLNVHAGGWNREYPDMLPPDPQLGTIEELRDLYERAQAKGFMVMPYSNPTWWDEVSPTVQNELPPLTIDGISVTGKTGPLWNTYGDNSGLVVSPCHPFVQYRIDRLMTEMTEDIPSDFIFEDQIGARTPMLDLNPDAPSPWSYSNCWFQHTKRHSSIGLGTEMGYDRLMETVIFFFGSTRLHKISIGNTRRWWGDANWHPYPMTSLMANDKVIFYQHNLPEVTTTISLENLSWNLAFGFSLSYWVDNSPDAITAWLDVASQLQARVVSRYAGERMTDYKELLPGVTQSVFPSVTVTTNWDEELPLSMNSHSTPPKGSMITSTDGCMVAGIFHIYNNSALTGGDHYFIIERFMDDDSIRVWQPMGEDTPIKIDLQPFSSTENLCCYGFAGDVIFQVPIQVNGQYGTFEWNRDYEDKKVTRYVIKINTSTSADQVNNTTPKEYSLEQNYPNPFNSSTKIFFTLPKSSYVVIKVYDILGKVVDTLICDHYAPGEYEVVWDARDLPGGIYLYRLKAGYYVETRKLILQK